MTSYQHHSVVQIPKGQRSNLFATSLFNKKSSKLMQKLQLRISTINSRKPVKHEKETPVFDIEFY